MAVPNTSTQHSMRAAQQARGLLCTQHSRARSTAGTFQSWEPAVPKIGRGAREDTDKHGAHGLVSRSQLRRCLAASRASDRVARARRGVPEVRCKAVARVPGNTRMCLGVLHPDEEVTFATFFIAPPPQAERDIESLAPDLRFIAALRRTYPGCHVVILTDLETRLSIPDDVQVFRCKDVDRRKMGRNSYANYAQLVCQIAYLRFLVEQGAESKHLVFMDTDMVVLDNILDVYGGAADVDYALTISDAPDMPINFGIQFVKRNCYQRAIDFLTGVLSIYDFTLTFTAGQEAIASYCGILNEEVLVLKLLKAAMDKGYDDYKTPAGYIVRFVPALRYNYCNGGQSCAVDASRNSASIPHTPADFAKLRVKVYHFVGHRKPGIALALHAFLECGQEAAYQVLAGLPNTAEEYERFFGHKGETGYVK